MTEKKAIKLSNSNIFSFSEKLIDNYDRSIDYLRVSVTHECNQSCTYCTKSPDGQNYPVEDTLSEDELLYLLQIFTELGIKKIRFTGGEPFLRKDFISILKRTIALPGIDSVNISTNGAHIGKYIDEIKELPLDSINISLDTLEEKKYREITGKNNLDKVLETINNLAYGKTKIKVNCVVIKDVNDREIIDIAYLSKLYPVDVRFCEVIPIKAGFSDEQIVTSREIYKTLTEAIPGISPAIQNTHNANMFEVTGFLGKIGIIGGFSRNFCSTCSKLKLSPSGSLKLCLYDKKSINLGQLVRYEYSHRRIKNIINHAVKTRYFDGYAAEESLKKSDNNNAIEM
ncbi:MAG: GTP 3',8-cyclase MoaA [Melioribacteraceae bacterium]|nr:MAG: GTP 3',8-cyclase MoaA [Melioribacteraceae bacterium]